MKFNLEKRTIILVPLILILWIFILVRLPGLHFSYHMDELKSVGDYDELTSSTPHPPLTQGVFVIASKIFGPDDFRAMPLTFGVINLILLFFLVKFKFGTKEAIWSAIFFTVAFYNVLASLMVDTDGEILPLFFLLSLFSYFKWQDAPDRNPKIIWGASLVVAIILGFLTKLSFIIVAGMFMTDFLLDKKKMLSRGFLIKYGLLALGFLLLLGSALKGARFIFPFYDLSRTISHAGDYFKISGRAYLQVLIESVKAVLYASPLLVAPLLFIKRRHLARVRPFLIFLFFSLLFYLVLFDFSRGALDKYLALIIVPLSIISGVIISEIMDDKIKYFSICRRYVPILLGTAVIVFVFFLQFIPHLIPPLYPKEEWVNRILELRWNFLFPFTGGSGPTGFYISWLFIVCSWILAVSLAILGIIKRNWQKVALVLILAVGFIYNAVFIEEYLFGRINGSPSVLLKDAVEFIKKNDQIKKVISYNGTGGYELNKIGKYERRMYAVPKYENEYRRIFNSFKGHYLVIDIPHINPSSLYGRHLSTCQIIYENYSKKISAKIYNCANAPNI